MTTKITPKNLRKVKKEIFRNSCVYRKDFCEYPILLDEKMTKKARRAKCLYKKILKKINHTAHNIINPLWNFPDKLFQHHNKNKLVFKHFNKIDGQEILLYVHFPFCSAMCTFCNVPNLIPPTKKSMMQYVYYLKKELYLYLKNSNIKEKTIKAVYFGGGTPALIPLEKLISFINYLQKNLKFDKNVDFTVEVHPKIINSSLGKKILTELQKTKVNRISMGIQCFNDCVLKINHRCHTSKEAIKAYKTLRRFNFILNIDMMFGLPGQTYKHIEKDLKILAKLKPDAIEYFRLEHVNPKINLLQKANESLFPNDETLWKMNSLVYQWLLKNNYEQNGTIKEQNKNYKYRYFCLKEIPYIAIGKGAVAHFGSLHTASFSKLNSYYNFINGGKLPIHLYCQLSKKEEAIRSFYLAIQLYKGISKADFKKNHNISLNNYFRPFIKNFKKLNLLEENQSYIKLTPLGSFFVSDICYSLIQYAEKKLLGKPTNKIKIGVKKLTQVISS